MSCPQCLPVAHNGGEHKLQKGKKSDAPGASPKKKRKNQKLLFPAEKIREKRLDKLRLGGRGGNGGRGGGGGWSSLADSAGQKIPAYRDGVRGGGQGVLYVAAIAVARVAVSSSRNTWRAASGMRRGMPRCHWTPEYKWTDIRCRPPDGP